MNGATKPILAALLFLLFLAGCALSFLYAFYPRTGDIDEIPSETTPEKLARGEYLSRHVAACVACHSERDFELYSGPVRPGSEWAGGERWTQEQGLPGTITAPNISPYALKNWTNEEIGRSIRVGVSKDGHALFPLMPYRAYANLCREDLNAIVAYLRTLEAKEKVTPPTVLDFPMNLIVRLIPEASETPPCPEPNDELARGAYLTGVAACSECHTPLDGGMPDENEAFAGGNRYPMSGGIARASNITPHPESGIGRWSREQFIQRFRDAPTTSTNKIGAGSPNTVMPWSDYAAMSDEDLGAIFEYLQNLPPIDKKIAHWSPQSKHTP